MDERELPLSARYVSFLTGMPCRPVATALNDAGREAVHVVTVGLLGRPDAEIMWTWRGGGPAARVRRYRFRELPTLGRRPEPRVETLPGADHRPAHLAAVLMANLAQLEPER